MYHSVSVSNPIKSILEHHPFSHLQTSTICAAPRLYVDVLLYIVVFLGIMDGSIAEMFLGKTGLIKIVDTHGM